MPILPLDLIEDILRRLPVKSLKRFRSVAKSWCFLIDSEKFVKSHLRQSLISNSNHHLILGGLDLYSIDLGPLDKARVIKPPFSYKTVDGVTNSCYGLVLVMSEPPVLWNPFSGSYRVLPGSSLEYPPGSDYYVMVSHGFGYDSKNDDYKVLKVLEFRDQSTHFPIRRGTEIYGLKSNSWKKIEDFPYSLPLIGGNSRAHVNGSFHTLVYTYENIHPVQIMAFSVETEKHYEVMLPKGNRIRNFELNLTVVGGYLGLICTNRSRVVIWVMEYGVEESWSKLLTIRSRELVKPLVYSRDGNKVLLNFDDEKLVWYDLRKKTVEQVHVDGIPFVFYAVDCVESLVSVGAPNEVKKQDREKKGKETMNKRDDFLSVGFNLTL
ncbi:F-box protein CPR1-like [Primulina huaijiensis]|uniref:F-box protein CPR1-like n=1 Tax=Primulina huaijiensis TaxID=1492673 RepID=UPI003CC745DB